MSRENDKAIVAYVMGEMPKRVKKALEDAKFDLHYGPGAGGMGWVKASKIVNDWWSENMHGDLVVDDGGNVSTEHDWEKFVEEAAKRMYKEALAQGKADDVDDEEERDTEYGYVTEREYNARQSADFEEQALNENATRYDAHDVRRLVLGSEWT